MRNSLFIHLAAVLLMASSADVAFAQGNVNELHPPINWGSQVPKGWSTGGNAQLRYGNLSGGVPDGKRAAIIMAVKKLAENDFGTLMQTIAADAYRGKRTRLSAMVSAEKMLASGRVALWMRVNDASGKVAAFDNMETRLVSAGTGWGRYDIVLDVPDNAASISFGVLLAGKEPGCCFGRVAASDFRLDKVDGHVAETAPHSPRLPDEPVNADFSQR